MLRALTATSLLSLLFASMGGVALGQSNFSIDGVTEDGGTDLEIAMTVEPDSGLSFAGTVDIFDCTVTDVTFTWLNTDCSAFIAGPPDILR